MEINHASQRNWVCAELDRYNRRALRDHVSLTADTRQPDVTVEIDLARSRNWPPPRSIATTDSLERSRGPHIRQVG